MGSMKYKHRAFGELLDLLKSENVKSPACTLAWADAKEGSRIAVGYPERRYAMLRSST